MATVLFIKRSDIVKNSIIDGGVDTDKFIYFIKLAQTMHVQNYLGTKLYDKITNDILLRTDKLRKQIDDSLKDKKLETYFREFLNITQQVGWHNEIRDKLKHFHKYKYEFFNDLSEYII